MIRSLVKTNSEFFCAITYIMRKSVRRFRKMIDGGDVASIIELV